MFIKLLLKLKIIKSIILFSLLFCSLLEYGCSPVGVLAGGGASTMVIAEGDRSVGSVVDDTTIKVQISSKFLSSSGGLFLNVNTKVREGRVLLTGIVQNQETRISAVKLAWEVDGVKEILNEIQIGDKETLKEYANDVWITTQIKALAAKNIGLRSLSYNFETIRGKVYIAGVTSHTDQLDILLNTIKNIKGVKEIVNYVIIKE